MKTTIYIIRHAQSIANEKGLFGGITDYILSKEGIEQAEKLSQRLVDYKIDRIYSSPLKRAIQTIKPTADRKNMDVIIVEGLREINVGEWENIPRDELRKKYPEENRYIDSTEYYCGMIGQEETSGVADRMLDAIKKLSIENAGKSIIITSHIVAIRAFLCKIMNIPFEQTKDKIGNLGNTSITKIEYDTELEEFEVIDIGSMNDSHKDALISFVR